MQPVAHGCDASDSVPGDYFGLRVAVSGDYAIAGANYDDDKGTNSGEAFIFKKDKGLWTQQAKLLSADGGSQDFFGGSVAISGDYALVGSYRELDNKPYSRYACMFKQTDGQWVQQAKFVSPPPRMDDGFGCSVAVEDDWACA